MSDTPNHLDQNIHIYKQYIHHLKKIHLNDNTTHFCRQPDPKYSNLYIF